MCAGWTAVALGLCRALGKPRDRQSGRYRSQRCYPTRSTDAVVGILVSTPVALIAATLDSAKHWNDRRSAFSDEDRTISEKKYLAGASYNFSDFDKYMCLSLGTVAWVVILFLMRPYVVLLVSVTNRSNRMEFIELVYPDRLWLAIDTVAALPAVILVAVTFLRRPNAASWVKALWKKGRTLLLASAVLNAIVAMAALALADSHKVSIVSPVLLCFSAWSLWYLLMSKRMRDVFYDFPVEEDPKTTKAKRTRAKRTKAK